MEGAGGHLLAKSERAQSGGEFAGGFAGEGEREDVSGIEIAGGCSIGDTASEDTRLAGAGSGENAEGRRGGGHRGALRAVQAVEKGIGFHDRDRTHLP